MGLDLVEFVMTVEETFDIRIPDRDLERITTPRILIDYLHARLGYAAAACPTQKAFYAVRRELRARLGDDAPRLRPQTRLADVLPARGRHRVWSRVGTALGVPGWPRAGPGTWFGKLFFRRVQTVGEAARFAAGYLSAHRRRPGPARSWQEIEVIVGRLVREELGVREFTLDARFVDDLRTD